MFPHHAFSSDFCMLVRCTLIIYTPFLFILNFHFVGYFLVNYKTKFIIGAQCNSLQQFLYLCIMSSFIHFPFKKINCIFSSIVN